MKIKKTIALASLALALGTVLIINVGAGGGGHEPFKLEGSWMANDGLGNSWMYTFAPSDPSGRHAAFHGAWVVADPTLGGVLPPDSRLSSFIGEAEMIRPDAAAYTVVWYTISSLSGAPQKVCIGVTSGVIKQVGPGKTEVYHNFSLYWPSQDADGDGLPDKGQKPFLCKPFKSSDLRLSLLPACTP